MCDNCLFACVGMHVFNALKSWTVHSYWSILRHKRNNLLILFVQFQQNCLNNEMKGLFLSLNLPALINGGCAVCGNADWELSCSRRGHWSNLQTISNDLLHTNESAFFTICPQTVACSVSGDITCTVHRNETAVRDLVATTSSQSTEMFCMNGRTHMESAM